MELAESVAPHDPQGVIAALQRRHQQGVRISIDDVGTDYPSLSHLKCINSHRLKIDPSFMRDITNDPEDKAIINTARSLGRITVAKGIETQAQLALLQKQGCDELQGRFFCKPQPPDELVGLLRGFRG